MSSLEDLARPPRAVPLSLRLALRLGGVGGTIGWMFLAMSMIFVLVFAALGDFRRMIALELATLSKTDGVALGWEPTNAHVNDAPVLANGASYHVNGQAFECRSYMVGAGLARGERVVVEYDPANPRLCRIEGMDVSVLPWWVMLIIAPFVLVGLIFAMSRWRRGGRLVRLLRDGKVAWGECVAKQPTNVRVNNQTQWKYTFRFEDELGRPREAFARTTDTWAMEDDPREAILYDPHQTELAMVADMEAKLLRLDGRGGWRAPGLRVAPRLIAPAISVALGVGTVLVF